MESHDLWIFKTVAKLQSVSKAAEKLGYVQSNVSQRIKCLEEELGTRLFIRNNRGVTLTNEGNVLLDYANQIILLMDEAKSIINPKKWRESLTIGAPQTISAVRIPNLLASFLLENKNIDVKVRTSDKQKLHEMLAYGELDGLFINGTSIQSQFDNVYSYFEKIVLISPKQCQMKKAQNPTLIVNSDTNCAYRNKLLDFANKNNFHDPTILEFDSLEAILQGVHDGLGISMLPADIVYNRKDLSSVQYQEQNETIKIDFVIQHRKQHPQSLKKFVRFLQKT
ncbi:LysR family transcriptional regulator [Bacillus sp. M6-12]|uniref:LysR family transcriptional regulator n=1 Tax=Bacillus sp. M6-12 TaxID=2054166 RepID=UPI000C760216|nr:LysR family transcriptional regulator [Bacillus sp. M6-12]PLS17356.1 LysR family transcriptional regulator [Bacillus sp. M6-12]